MALIPAKGDVLFISTDCLKMSWEKAPEVTEWYQRYHCVRYSRDGKKATLEFPIIKFTDYYPNCDGEYDRWDESIIGCHPPIICY